MFLAHSKFATKKSSSATPPSSLVTSKKLSPAIYFLSKLLAVNSFLKFDKLRLIIDFYNFS